MRKKKTMFFPPKNKFLAERISIESPEAFRASIKLLEENGLTKEERRALVLAQNRATAQLNRKNLSDKEIREMTEISKIRIPKVQF